VAVSHIDHILSVCGPGTFPGHTSRFIPYLIFGLMYQSTCAPRPVPQDLGIIHLFPEDFLQPLQYVKMPLR